MDYLAHKRVNSKRRAHRVRATVTGSTERPRLAIFISNIHVTAQIVDDSTSKTLAYASTVGKKVEGNMTAKAEFVGVEIAKSAKKAKVSKVVFDRSGRKYHGRIKALAEAARKGGLEF
jgi:large subunit ribosomal protein L18